MTAYYNEFDPQASEWLLELMRDDHIPDGVIDTRSILDVEPSDLVGFTQCHFFAGIGGWPLALRIAGVSDDEPLWTGSPPCQPFSVAGEGKSKDDERHLAPKFASLVGACRPRMLFGEQVASSAVLGKAASATKRNVGKAPEWAWIDDLSDRLEAAHYAVGASDIPSAGIGAPHIRQRTFFGAYDLRSASIVGLDDAASKGGCWGQPLESRGYSELGRPNPIQPDGLAESNSRERNRLSEHEEHDADGATPGRKQGNGKLAGYCGVGGMAFDNSNGQRAPSIAKLYDAEHYPQSCGGSDELGIEAATAPGGIGAPSDVNICLDDALARLDAMRSGPLDGFWGNADWLFCRDGKWRPVEPGTFPLAHGVSGRVGLLRGYGNAINPWAAAEFIRAFTESVEHVTATTSTV